MIRIVDACKAECDSCRLQGIKACAVIERSSGTKQVLCLTHTLALVADLMLCLLAIQACSREEL